VRAISVLFIIFFSGCIYGLDLDEASFNFAEKLYLQKKYTNSLAEFSNFIDKFPDSAYYNKALLYKSKVYFILKDYILSCSAYKALENNAANDNDRKTAIFGEGESYYRMKDWSNAALTFKEFALKYKNSPVSHAALYYAGRSYENLNRYPEARIFFECLISAYPESSYYREALKELTGAVVVTNGVAELTNVVIYSNIESVPAVNFSTNSGSVQQGERDKKQQEEVQRYMELIELKEKLLDLKEKAINEKKDILYETNIVTNTDENTN
jgi:tetratricopeptide (TPR) repeat protein